MDAASILFGNSSKFATRIKMKPGCSASNKASEIAEIYIDGPGANQFYPKDKVHDDVKENPGSIKVKLGEYPNLLAATSNTGEKYVRSEANDNPKDNLLQLPRERQIPLIKL